MSEQAAQQPPPEGGQERDPSKIGTIIVGGLLGGVVLAKGIQVLGGLLRLGVQTIAPVVIHEVLRKPAGSPQPADGANGEPAYGFAGREVEVPEEWLAPQALTPPAVTPASAVETGIPTQEPFEQPVFEQETAMPYDDELVAEFDDESAAEFEEQDDPEDAWDEGEDVAREVDEEPEDDFEASDVDEVVTTFEAEEVVENEEYEEHADTGAGFVVAYAEEEHEEAIGAADAFTEESEETSEAYSDAGAEDQLEEDPAEAETAEQHWLSAGEPETAPAGLMETLMPAPVEGGEVDEPPEFGIFDPDDEPEAIAGPELQPEVEAALEAEPDPAAAEDEVTAAESEGASAEAIEAPLETVEEVRGFGTVLPPPRDPEVKPFQPRAFQHLDADAELEQPEPESDSVADRDGEQNIVDSDDAPGSGLEEEDESAEQNFDPIAIFKAAQPSEGDGLAIFEPGSSATALAEEKTTASRKKLDSAFAPAMFPVDARDMEQVEPVENPFAGLAAKVSGNAAATRDATVKVPSLELAELAAAELESKPEPEALPAPSGEAGGSVAGKVGGALMAAAVIGGGAYFGWHVLAGGMAGDPADPPTVASPEQAVPGEELASSPVAPSLLAAPVELVPESIDDPDPAPAPEFGAVEGEPAEASLSPEAASGVSAETVGDVGPDALEPGGAEDPVANPGVANPGVENPVLVVGDPDAAVRAFLEAATVEERYLFVHQKEVDRDELRSFYQQVGDKPFTYTSIERTASGTIPGTEFETHLYIVKAEGFSDGFVMSVEQTADGYRVDWKAFVQFAYRKLETFAEDQNSPLGSFYVAAKRSHYFGSGVPDAENMLCLRLISPVDSSREIYAFARADSLAADEVKELFRWGRTYRPVVTLEWVSVAGESYIRLKHVDRMSWRGE